MQSPYLLFVKLLASVIGGQYPEHYDSLIKRKIRTLWVIGIPTMVSLAWYNEDRLVDAPLTLTNAVSSPRFIGLSAVIIIFAVLSWKVARLRTQSIEKHILETNPQRVIEEDSTETTQDALHLLEYIKTYFVLTVLSHSNLVALLILPEESVIPIYLKFALYLPSLYYIFVLFEFLNPLIGRWGRQLIQNDKSSSSPSQSES